jgi:MPBQ/MSBQ methyltransferase
MTVNQTELKERLKKRLFDSISAQIDLIGYVPDDIAKLVKDFTFDTKDADQVSNEAGLESGEITNAVMSADKEKLAELVNDHYDHVFYDQSGMMEILYGDTQYRNIGHWDETTLSQDQASERLQDTLLDFIPEKLGRILDVACGMGASTRRLLSHYPAENIWAINISEKQIESTRRNAPGCNAQVMNAVDMEFDNDFFDSILCIEAAMHFEPRQKFLEESFRVLKTGGRLVLSDILVTSRKRLTQLPMYHGPDNHIETIDEYYELLSAAGFSSIVINDESKNVWGAHFLQAVNRIHEKFYAGDMSIIELTETLWTYYNANAVMGTCLLISAQK